MPGDHGAYCICAACEAWKQEYVARCLMDEILNGVELPQDAARILNDNLWALYPGDAAGGDRAP